IRAALVTELERDRAGHIPASGVAAQCDPIRIDAALSCMFEQPTHDEFTFLHLNWPLVLGCQLVVHAVDLSATALCEKTHRGLELIERADNEANSVQLDHRTSLRSTRLGGMIDSNRDGAVRTAKAKVFDLADRGLHLIDEGVMFAALDMDRLVGAENRCGLQPL